jgi:hypothetical protein
MPWTLENVFFTEPISGVTINQVFVNPDIVAICYVVAVIAAASAAIVLKIKGYPLRDSLRKAALASFLAGGFFYAFYADLGWARWIRDDMNEYHGLKTSQKLYAMDDRLFEFSMSVKAAVPDRYTLYSTVPDEEYPVTRLEYLLLPLKKAEEARYAVVFLDGSAVFYPGTGRLERDGLPVGQFDMVFKYAENAYLLRKK